MRSGPWLIRQAALMPRRVFYGWWLVGAGFVAGLIQTALFSLGFGAFFLPIAQEFNTTRGALSGAFSAVRIEGGVLGPIAGYLVDKVGPRAMMAAGFILFGTGLIVTSRVTSIPQFYAAFLLTGVGAYLCWYIPATTAAINWFSRLRSRALSLVLLGSVVGGPLIPVLAWSIDSFGWRATLVGSGIFVWAVGLPLAALMRGPPEDYGCYPDGDVASQDGASPDSAESASFRAASNELTLAQALRSSRFWYLATAHSISLLAWGALSVHMIPAMVDVGLSEQLSATMVGVTLGIAIIGRLWAGFFSGILGTKPSLVVAFAFQTGALVSLSLATSLAWVVLFAVLMGLGYGARGILLVTFRGELFGRRSYATITGILEPILTVGFVVGPLLAGVLYDFQESYRLAFVSLAALNFAGLFFLLPIAIPRRG